MPPVIESMELAQVIAEAADIAASVKQKLTSAHQLLAFFTVPNRAEILLKERGIDEDRLLAAMTGKPKEPEGVLRDLRERSREVAESVGAEEVDCLHLLIAMGRVRASAAHQLLGACGLQLSTLRNVALSYFTASMPRRLRELQPVQVRPAQPLTPPRRSEPRARAADPSRDLQLDAHLEQALGDATATDGEAVHPERGVSAAADTRSRGTTPPPTSTDAPEAAHPERSVSADAETRSRGTRARRSPHALDPKELPWLSQLGRNLTELAAAGRLDPLVGREQEVEEAIDVLGKRRTNNPLLVGEPGVGKTAIVEGIAQRLLQSARERVIVEIDMASVVAGTSLRGAFSEKLLGIQEEVRRAAGRVVVFIDEIHTLMGAGQAGEGPQDAANELKAALGRGEFPCIGATTHDEYRQHIEKDPALERRFTPVLVREPSVADTVTILRGLAPRYEKHHRVRFADGALEAAASLSARYVTDRFLPDKAVSALDLAGSRASRAGAAEVDAADVARTVAKMAGIPESRLLASDRERILGLEVALRDRVVGHADAIARVAAVLKRNFAGFATRRPMGSFLFLGPTGVGKTELARALADALYGAPDALVQLDMSECAETTGVARLVGAAPGYVGYGEGGQLTDAVRRRPASVVVLDEIEKAHRDVQMLLLQVLEEGRLTDGRGRQVDFSNAVVVLTSNLGAEEATRTSTGAMGFGAAERVQPRTDRVLQAARGAVPPELWNRLDERVCFSPLSREDVAKVARLLVAGSSRRLEAERRIRFEATDGAIAHLVENGGFDAALGARPMRGAIQRLVEAPLAERILAGELGPGDVAIVDVDAAGGLRFDRAARA
ncbi:AAA family ATPase [Anaeromyxobacter sp. Fw109-5]|uniref:AAA family ATPase n=1 Tax=Anaeromyxobacter sp. (strain Fw109-5) TaxID=404589 RepID=UPI0000ED7DA8|nr:ATP-dependent Clp protease ATP-binding subunit [Anaeromyxobacter sp. Fw109-5]ABS25673.1 ATPase AAA-2 domain protein [Anaeromyxobacter sp. Fw109-5]